MSLRFGYYPGQDDITKDRPVAFLVRIGGDKLQFRIGSPGIDETISEALRKGLADLLTNQNSLNRWIKWAVDNPDEASVDSKHLSRSTLMRILLHIVPDPGNRPTYLVSSVAVEDDRKEWYEFKHTDKAAETLEDVLYYSAKLIKNVLTAYQAEKSSQPQSLTERSRRTVN